MRLCKIHQRIPTTSSVNILHEVPEGSRLSPTLFGIFVAGLIHEEDEGIGIASDVVKVKGEDPATPGCLREVRVRWCVSDFQSWVRTLLARS